MMQNNRPRERFGIKMDKEYFNFGCAHFLIFADGSREELHGHNYRAMLELDANLDDGNLVADFLVVKHPPSLVLVGKNHS